MSNELQTINPQPVSTTTPMEMIGLALSQGADIAKIEMLMNLQERWEEREAMKAYNKAFAAFKAETIEIIKNISVNDGPLKGKKYADLFAVVDAATPALAKHGLSASWKMTKDEPNWIEVTCILKHELGHSQDVSMGGPPDKGGAKNEIQARASSINYLERYTFLAITGLAAKDGDRDGNYFGIAEDEFQQHKNAINNAKTIESLQEIWKAAMDSAKKDPATQAAYIKAKDARKQILRSNAVC